MRKQQKETWRQRLPSARRSPWECQVTQCYLGMWGTWGVSAGGEVLCTYCASWCRGAFSFHSR